MSILSAKCICTYQKFCFANVHTDQLYFILLNVWNKSILSIHPQDNISCFNTAFIKKTKTKKKAPLTHCDPITANTCHMFFGSLTLLIIKKGTKNRVIQFVRSILRKQHGGNKPKTLYVICLLTFNRQLWVISQKWSLARSHTRLN